MACKNCNSDRLMYVQAHCSDLGYIEYPKHDVSHDGYFPTIPDVCGGDDAAFTFCLECGMIQGEFPISDETVKAAFAGDPDDYDDDEDRDDWGQIREKEKNLPEEIMTTVMIMPSAVDFVFSHRGELMEHPRLVEVKSKPNFKQWVTSVSVGTGRYLAGAFMDDDGNIMFEEVARVPLDLFTNYVEVSENDYDRYRI